MLFMDFHINNNEYHSHNHRKYLILYHIIWCPKFRFSVLTNKYSDDLKIIIKSLCDDKKYKIIAIEVMPDHVHILIDCPVTESPCDIVRYLKSKSAIMMFKNHIELKHFYKRCQCLWSRGYFIASVGNTNKEIVKKYIEEQIK